VPAQLSALPEQIAGQIIGLTNPAQKPYVATAMPALLAGMSKIDEAPVRLDLLNLDIPRL
jgi:hypothetical protein